MFLSKYAAQKCIENLTEDLFYLDSHNKIFSVLKDLLENNTPIDITTVTNDEGGQSSTFTPGVMEFAIMRNNIYSLSIGTISEIGSATVLPTPGTVVADQGAYITMQAKILPWIVRFNDINF